EVYLKVFKAAHLVRALRLSRVELGYLIEGENVEFDLDELPLTEGADPQTWVPWESLAQLVDLLDLQRSIPFKSGSLFELWRSIEGTDPQEIDAGEMAEEIGRRTGWRAQDVSVLRGLFDDLQAPEAAW